jgi:2-polyprenyl-3-methyl-5-hydroxy-6-metoxy-1,4-benzoquinol methylase
MLKRQHEIDKYERAYCNQRYRLGPNRMVHITYGLRDIERGSLLDVGCGRGEVLDMAEKMGFDPVMGVEAVGYLCDGKRIARGLVHDLPMLDKSFDVVTMFDVMEHILPDDTDSAVRHLERIARKTILLTVHNGPSTFNSEELHINRKGSYDEWFDYFKSVFSGKVEWLPRHESISEMFKVTYG